MGTAWFDFVTKCEYIFASATRRFRGDGPLLEVIAKRAVGLREAKLLTAERAQRLPGAEAFVKEVERLSASAQLAPPKIYVHAGEELDIGMPRRDTLVISEKAIAGDMRRTRAVVGHELGHAANGDTDKLVGSGTVREQHAREYAADAFSAKITGDPDALISTLKADPSEYDLKPQETHPSVRARINRLERWKKRNGFTAAVEADRPTHSEIQK